MGTVTEPLETIDLPGLANLANDFVEQAEQLLGAKDELTSELTRFIIRTAELNELLSASPSGLQIGEAALSPAELGDHDLPPVRVRYALLDDALELVQEEDEFASVDQFGAFVESQAAEQETRGSLRNALAEENAICVVTTRCCGPSKSTVWTWAR